MSNERASIFGSDDIDLSEFTPAVRPKADKQAIRQAAEQRGFSSREPAAPAAASEKPRKTAQKAVPEAAAPPALPEDWRPRRRPVRTGRNQQFNMKASAEVIQRFYKISDDQRWVLGETLERALDALERELGAKK